MANRPATDKQCNYLNHLREKVCRIQSIAESHGTTVYKEPIAELDYFNERDKGMTTADADQLIKAWRIMVVYGNMTLSLFNLPQV